MTRASLLKAGFLAASLFVAGGEVHAQTQNDHAKAKTEVKADETVVLGGPLVVDGTSAKASNLSYKHQSIGVYVQGGPEGASMGAAAYLANNLFANPDIANEPENIVAVAGKAGGKGVVVVYYAGGVDPVAVFDVSDLKDPEAAKKKVNELIDGFNQYIDSKPEMPQPEEP